MPRPRTVAPTKRLLRIPASGNVVPNSKVSLSDGVKRCGQRYGASFKSGVPRFRYAKGGRGAPSSRKSEAEPVPRYNTDIGTKAPMATIVARGHRGRFSQSRRFSTSNPVCLTNRYVTTGGVADQVAKSDRRYAVVRSRTPRFAHSSNKAKQASGIGPGDTEPRCEAVARRPRSAVIPRSPRFTNVGASEAPDAMYNIDAANKATLATQAATSGRRYSVMGAQTPRFGPPGPTDRHLREALANVEYDTDCGANKTIGHTVQTSSNRHKIVFENQTPRFTGGKDMYLREALSYVDYNVDTGNKTTLQTSVKNSSIKYSAVRTQTRRFSGSDWDRSSTPSHMGPGWVDNDPPLIRRRPRSAVISTASRFNGKRDASKYLGSTFRMEKANQAWNKPVVLSKTERPSLAVKQLTDKVSNVDQGRHMSLTTAMQRSPRKYTIMKSNAPRLSSPATATGPELGPGCYSPHVRMQGGFNEMSRRDDWARTQPVFVSTTDRFAKSAWTAR